METTRILNGARHAAPLNVQRFGEQGHCRGRLLPRSAPAAVCRRGKSPPRPRLRRRALGPAALSQRPWLREECDPLAQVLPTVPAVRGRRDARLAKDSAPGGARRERARLLRPRAALGRGGAARRARRLLRAGRLPPRDGRRQIDRGGRRGRRLARGLPVYRIVAGVARMIHPGTRMEQEALIGP